MILVTGGLGFIGQHTVRALLDLGEECVATRHRCVDPPALLAGSGVRVEPADVTDAATLRELGRKYPITGIVHLAEGGYGLAAFTDDLRLHVTALMNVLDAAHEWGVSRITIASTIGVYAGVTGDRFVEDTPLPMTAPHAIVLRKKTAELLAGFVAERGGLDLVALRIAGVYGPLGHTASNLAVAGRLVHAAVAGRPPEGFRPYSADGIDWCYAADCGRAIAMVQTATGLRHRTYNIGTGLPTTNGELVAALREVIPDKPIELPEGFDPAGPGQPLCLDTTRLREDTGFTPAFPVTRGVAEYVDWLRCGHPE